MTIINNIEIDHITYTRNIIKDAIVNNDPIESKLHVIIVISNPCLFARRYILAREFIQRFEKEEPDVILYIVEVAYGKQKFLVTEKGNPRHLQLHTDAAPLWLKENMINLGVQRLLPPSWKAFAWIDADLEFESTTWAKDTLKVLNGCKDVVQLYSHAVDMNRAELAMSVFNSFGYQAAKGHKYCGIQPNFWHPGFAWACTRRAYEKAGGLYEKAILGSGDNIMAFSMISNGIKSVNKDSTDEYKNSILEYQERVKNFRVGYVPGVVRHYYHGSKINRKYRDRWMILVNHKFNPDTFITKDANGLLIPTEECPTAFLDEIMQYFLERNEDEL